ncbi:MAG: hypothetical protein JGK24_29525 [Microcoleus sp. PH2017_29_MFU_D_A]|uniref:hypothetical protein n=1 Tax=unclassified Microcoleus TaxID=2642155 RepID=UPI001D5DFFAB|nr:MULTISPECIES: hypothetical protein [unclassified Microcoleus]MCC3421884.1 hypothetical protein [Microcoleus sp. PH2017_07_MST_O_A]MCC3430566.1 hypothetical protein [Microcoleus sp. PH2017_04_SCI_O_A]MCC3441035.1 hypothetical protein [Microcoleus sp. PH2017_03_ELD_O_A]MCC3466508.1 hypothetical protein [Microcoleus sp. PH2017_06_SFM_O_A]MCC3507015.1 hypothetical protein [Microcoleus sp. PH2017_19_SFW_U_A]MCC3511981.1 hypothetical protein [Microcoleus sp. PH2017_17_BER_D_A]
MIQLIELLKLARQFKLEIIPICDRTGSPHHHIPKARPRVIQQPPPVKLAIALKIGLLW